MIEERGRVIATEGEFALVEAQRESACGHCKVQSGCGTSLLSRFVGNRHNRLRVANPVDAKPGDSVVIGLNENALTGASVTLYLLPILALIAAAVAGQLLAHGIGLTSTEPASIVGGLLGLTAGLVLARRRANRLQGDRRQQAVILRLLEPRPVVFDTGFGGS